MKKLILRRRQNRALKGADNTGPLKYSAPETAGFSPQSFILFVAFLSLVLCGCANLAAVRSFSKISSESSSYTAFTDDYVKTAQRQKRYQEEGGHKGEFDEIIRLREAEQAGLRTMLKVLSDYMDSLGELASDEIIHYDKNVDAITKELGSIKDKNGKQLLRQDEINAFGNVSKLLSKAVTDAYRRDKLKKVISEANESLQKIIASLKNFIENGYIESLRQEKASARQYYNEISVAAKRNSSQEATIGLLREKLFGKEDAIEAKIEAARQYLDILDKIAKGHQLLYNKRDKISSAETLSAIMAYSKDIADCYVSVREIK